MTSKDLTVLVELLVACYYDVVQEADDDAN